MANPHSPPSRSRIAISVGKDPPTVDGTVVRNEILLNLPSKESDSVFSNLSYVPLRTHDVLHEPGEPIQFAYFINSGMASVLNVFKDGKSVEVGLTGKEGFVGLPLIVGLRSSPTQTIIQIEATGFRIGAAAFEQLLRECPALEKRLQRFVQVLAMQATQVAACNRVHEVDERLARWLLMCQDRIGSSSVHLTQEFLSQMLGTRRSSVTVAAGMLHNAGLITYTRGEVEIENRSGLVKAACECYESMRRQADHWQTELS